MTIVAIVLAAFGALVLLFAAAAAIATVLPWWAGFLIVGGVLLVAALILTLIAKSHFNKSKDYEVSFKDGIDKSVDAFKRGIKKPEE